jgi:hypothetical protein
VYEDRLLAAHWQHQPGMLFREVPVGSREAGWPPGTRIRRIDGIIILGRQAVTLPYRPNGTFESAIEDADIHLIEVKRKLNRFVLGQVIIGTDMFRRDYRAYGSLKPIVVCEISDPGLELICKRRRIKVCRTDPLAAAPWISE